MHRLITKVIIVLVIFVFGLAAGSITRYFMLHNRPVKSIINEQVVIPTNIPVNSGSSLPLNTFGLNVFNQLYSQNKTGNLFISPLSIYFALSMAYNGADGTTKEIMAKTLGVDKITIDQINRDNLSLAESIADPISGVEVAIANSIWAKEGSKFNQDFLKVNQDYYKARIDSLYFGNPEAAKIINNWVKDNTGGKIPTIINPPIPSDMVMYLINAVYFKGTWTYEFDNKLTAQKDFTLINGTKQKISAMEQKNTYDYQENNLFQAIRLPYGKNQSLGMYIFLPKSDVSGLMREVNGTNWDKWLLGFNKSEGTVTLPKYKIEYEKNLNETLKALGMEIAFSNNANFNKMKDKETDVNLAISEVIHKTYIEINEEGTEAAAATSVGMRMTSVGGNEKAGFNMDINRPFLFAITESKTSAILFVGIVQNPT